MTRLQEGMEPVKQTEEFEPIQKTDRGVHWNQEQLELFLKLYNQGKKYREIAEAVGKDVNAIVNKVWALGLKRKRFGQWTEQELVILIRMQLQGQQETTIAKRLKRTHGSIREKISELGLTKRQLKHLNTSRN